MSPAIHAGLIALHALAAAVWVGGMFFAYVALRPAAGALLEPPQRCGLLQASLARFLPWVWVSVVALLATGLALIAGYGGLAAVGAYVHAMFAIGLVMMAVFVYLWFVPYRRLRRAVAARDWPAGGGALDRIRGLIAFNLALGLLTIAIGAGGRVW